jgi:hypothetical protein
MLLNLLKENLNNKNKKRKSLFAKIKTSVQNKFNDMNHAFWRDSIHLAIKGKNKRSHIIKNNINSVLTFKVINLVLRKF